MQYTKNCKYCGNEFLTTNKNRIYCSRECSNNEIAKKKREKHKQERELLESKKQNNLVKINEAARAAGLSYGKYVALQYAKTVSFDGGEDESKM